MNCGTRKRLVGCCDGTRREKDKNDASIREQDASMTMLLSQRIMVCDQVLLSLQCSFLLQCDLRQSNVKSNKHIAAPSFDRLPDTSLHG